MQEEDQKQLKLKQLELLQRKAKLKEELPHLYGFQLLPFQKKWLESKHQFNLLFASNQCGKSTINVIKAITWATTPELWPTLWPESPKPLVFWYMYPDAKTASSEIQNKWIPEFLPKGEFKDHPVYGWRIKNRQGHPSEIIFNAGVTIQLKYYSQGATALQGASIWALFGDEEIPWEIVGEIRLRLIAKSGYFHLVCTPTLGQEEWARTIEPEYIGTDKELFKKSEIDILKMQVSMYDCLKYANGNPSHITEKRIEQIKATLTEREQLVRIYGRFLAEDGLKYPTFDEEQNVTNYKPLSHDHWNFYAGIDWGGGGSSHESGIVVVAVNRSFTQARVVWSWISKGERTTAGDVLEKYRRIVLSRWRITRCFYDYSCKDLGTLADRAGVPMEKAEKSHEIGVPLLNTLFKTSALKVYHDWNNTGDNFKLISELKRLLVDTKKRHADDTLCDALRYALSRLSFALDDIVQGVDVNKDTLEKLKRTTRADYGAESNQQLKEQVTILTEMEDWDELCSNDFFEW